MSLTKDQCIQKVQRQIGTLRDKAESDNISVAVDMALLETGWTFPITNTLMEYCVISRAKRHLYHTFLSVNAYKFKFKQINLQNRFEHFRILVRDADRDFEKFKEEHPELFLTLLGDGTRADLIAALGSKIDAGFRYDDLGRDVTYEDANLVQMNPNEEGTS